MKKAIILYIIVLITGGLSSCKRYLDLAPKNQRTIESVEDVKAVLSGYLYSYAKRAQYFPVAGPAQTFSAAELMMFESYSDNIDFVSAFNQHAYLGPNNSTPELFYANELLWNDYTTPELVWNTYYGSVGFANTLIDQLGELKTAAGDETIRNQMLGELYTHRAFYLFKLLEYFAPYDNAAMGIPVYLHSGEQVYGIPNPRRTQQEVYDIIIKDLESALATLGSAPPKPGFNVWYNERYINNILAQVYWFKAESGVKAGDDYENARKYSLEAVKDVDAYIPVTTAAINQAFAGTLTSYPVFTNASNSFSATSSIYGSSYASLGSYYPLNIPVSADLYASYDTADIRLPAYFGVSGTLNANFPEGRAFGNKSGQFLLFQPEEAYLILAEAYYRLNKEGDSRTTLNKFKAFLKAGIVTDQVTGPALLEAIKLERRKEFCFQRDVRWLDLKRYGGVTLNRSFTFLEKSYNVTVPPKDFRYALPVPLTELQQNPQLTANPGWVQINF